MASAAARASAPRTRNEGAAVSAAVRFMWLLLAVVLSIPGSVSQTWIEVKETPTLGRVGKTVKPNAVLGLWTDRSAEDAFGNPLPSKQLWDSMEPSVNVNVSLFSAGGERVDHHLLGTRPVAVKCGVVKFTDLEVNQMGEFYLQFSATYLGDEPTVNRSSTFGYPSGSQARSRSASSPTACAPTSRSSSSPSSVSSTSAATSSKTPRSL